MPAKKKSSKKSTAKRSTAKHADLRWVWQRIGHGQRVGVQFARRRQLRANQDRGASSRADLAGRRQPLNQRQLQPLPSGRGCFVSIRVTTTSVCAGGMVRFAT